MADHKIVRSDCGYRLRAWAERSQVTEARRHAWKAHGISLSTEETLVALLRRELGLDEAAPAGLAMLDEVRLRGKGGRDEQFKRTSCVGASSSAVGVRAGSR